MKEITTGEGKTMITLFTFGPAFGLPDPSPFVIKAEMLLKLSGLPYDTRTGGFGRAPKGKLPYIRDGEAVIADSTLIRLHLERRHGIDFDGHLTARERGIGWAAEKMIEDQLYWVLVYWRWIDDANFNRGMRFLFQRAPAPIRPLAVHVVRRRVRNMLHAHGMGRHSKAEMTDLASRGIDALAQILGDNRYFLGDRPGGADATLFAFLACSLCPILETPLRAKLEAMPALVAYCDRMFAEYFPAFTTGRG